MSRPSTERRVKWESSWKEPRLSGSRTLRVGLSSKTRQKGIAQNSLFTLTTSRPTNAILAPNFKFEDMGIGGLDTEFSAIFRRAFASRIFPPGLVEKLGIQHVKGKVECQNFSLTSRNSVIRSSWYWQNSHGSPDWQDAECSRTQSG